MSGILGPTNKALKGKGGYNRLLIMGTAAKICQFFTAVLNFRRLLSKPPTFKMPRILFFLSVLTVC